MIGRTSSDVYMRLSPSGSRVRGAGAGYIAGVFLRVGLDFV